MSPYTFGISKSRLSLTLVFCMTLDTQRLFAVEPGMIIVVGTLGSMTAGTRHHLPGSRIKHIFTDRMGEGKMLSMATGAHIVNRCLEHGRMIGTVRRMAIITRISHLVFECGNLMFLESRFVALAAVMAILAFE